MDKQKLIECLTRLIEGKGAKSAADPYHARNLCALLRRFIGTKELEDIMAKWPGFSGCTAFPVPCSLEGLRELKDKGILFHYINDLSPPDERAELAFMGVMYEYFWDQSTEYGRNRLALAKWLLAYFTEGQGNDN